MLGDAEREASEVCMEAVKEDTSVMAAAADDEFPSAEDRRLCECNAAIQSGDGVEGESMLVCCIPNDDDI